MLPYCCCVVNFLFLPGYILVPRFVDFFPMSQCTDSSSEHGLLISFLLIRISFTICLLIDREDLTMWRAKLSSPRTKVGKLFLKRDRWQTFWLCGSPVQCLSQLFNPTIIVWEQCRQDRNKWIFFSEMWCTNTAGRLGVTHKPKSSPFPFLVNLLVDISL